MSQDKTVTNKLPTNRPVTDKYFDVRRQSNGDPRQK